MQTVRDELAVARVGAGGLRIARKGVVPHAMAADTIHPDLKTFAGLLLYVVFDELKLVVRPRVSNWRTSTTTVRIGGTSTSTFYKKIK